jgi:2-polyprenyl-6-hydroxyphenyl methylase/3-demethylubiquinone-9 3-methyltransferase
MHDLLAAHLPRAAGARFLEVGCGGGSWLVHFGREFGYAVTGCDSSTTGCRLARESLMAAGIEGTVIEGDLFALEGDYDIVFSAGLVEHFEDPAPVIGKLASLLVPGGVLFTMVPNLTGLSGLYHRLWKPETFETHRPVTATDLSQWYRSAGVRIGALGALGSIVPRRLPRRAIQARHPGLYRLLWPAVLGPLTWATSRACLLAYRRFGLRVESERFSPYLYAVGRREPGTAP